MLLVFGMTVVGCDDGSTNNGDSYGTRRDVLDGTTWKGSFTSNRETIQCVLTFYSPAFILSSTERGRTHVDSGTYTISGSSVTLTARDDLAEATTTGILSGNTLDFRGDGGPLFIKQ